MKTNQDYPKVAVLILSYNGKELLDDSVSSYLMNDYPNFEVVVIDNGSTDDTKSYVEKNWPSVKVLRTEKNLKYSGGLNFGLNYAFNNMNSDFSLITNNDVKVDREVINSFVEVALDQPKAAFVTGKVYYYDHPNIIQTVGKGSDELLWRSGHIGNKEEDKGQYNIIREIPWCDDIYWLVTREIYEKVGGYDTEFEFQAEDFDWQARAKAQGFKIFYTHKAKMWHKDSITIGKHSPFKSYYDFRNPLIVHMKHRDYEKFKYYLQLRRKSLLKLSIKKLLKFEFYYVFCCWKGFISAGIWGIKNKRVTISQLLFG